MQTTSSTRNIIKPDNEFLNSNLEYLASLTPPTISPVLPQLPEGAGLLPESFQLTSNTLSISNSSITETITTTNNNNNNNNNNYIILQVNAVEDVSLPQVHRLRAIIPPDSTYENELITDSYNNSNNNNNNNNNNTDSHTSVEETLKAMEENEENNNASPRKGRRQRLLQFILTDGFTRIIALEDCQHGCQSLKAGLSFGAKLQIYFPLIIKHGILILKSENTILLGGCVPQLQSFWVQRAKELLLEMSGRPMKKNKNQNNQNQGEIMNYQAIVQRENNGNIMSSVGELEIEEDVVNISRNTHANNIINSTATTTTTTTAPTLVTNSIISNNNNISNNNINNNNILNPSPANNKPINTSSLSLSLLSTLQIQPLSAWPQHYPPNSPFLTVANISEVTSELTIRENVKHNSSEGSELFSLLVLLTGNQNNNNNNNNLVNEDSGLVVDLGHRWLQEALGMNVESFRKISLSREVRDITLLETLVENIGRRLENFGEAQFVLKQREDDGIIEVIEVRQLRA